MLVLLMGPSGCGKSSVAKMLDYPRLISNTTRPPRVGEVGGYEYNFVSLEMFHNLDLVESTIYVGNHYGYLKSDIDKCKDPRSIYVGIVDRHGVVALRGLMGKNNILAISIRASKKNLITWMKKRGDSEVNILQRLTHLDNDSEILENEKIADRCVVSDELEDLAKDINKLIIKKLVRMNHGSK